MERSIVTVSPYLFYVRSIKAGGIFSALEVIKSLQLKPPGNGSHPSGCMPDCTVLIMTNITYLCIRNPPNGKPFKDGVKS